MQIKINTVSLQLSDKERALIERKVEHLAKLGSRLTDESSEIKVDLAYRQTRRQQDAYFCSITFFVPRDTIRAEAHGERISSAVDEVVDKLKTQIEYYKNKTRHLHERKP